MVKITWYRPQNRVTVVGHANAAPKGEDLVCAAVSALTYTLAANALELKQEGVVKCETVTLKEGHSEVQIYPKRIFKRRAERAISAVCLGFELLARQYPEHVAYTIY